MSARGTQRLGDVHALPGCAPAGLKKLFTTAEGIIQEQIRHLGSGTPSEAPNLRKLLRGQGIDRPQSESTMIDNYADTKKKVDKATSDITRSDDGIVVHTTGVVTEVTKAYGAIHSSVADLNTVVDDSFDQVFTAVDEYGKHRELPKSTIEGLFNAVWKTLNTTYTEAHGVSDQAAAAARKIRADAPAGPPAGGTTPMPYTPSPSTFTGSDSGPTPWSVQPASMGTAIIPTGDKPTAMAMMNYLIDTYHFTPAQAAGIVANAKFESGFDVSATGDNGSAKGLFQWRFGRQDGLRDFADNPGEDIGDWHTHLDYMVQELRGGDYQQANAAVNANEDDPRAVAESFDRYYEKSAGLSTNDRRDYAAGLLSEYNQSHTSMAV